MQRPDQKLVDHIGATVPDEGDRIAAIIAEEMASAIAGARAIDDNDATEAAIVCSILANAFAAVLTSNPSIAAKPTFAMSCIEDIAKAAQLIVGLKLLRGQMSRAVVVE